MELMKAIIGRRAIRKYRSDPVTNEELATVLEAARWAPSWGNTQCWRLVIVRDPEVKAQLAGAIRSSHPGRDNPALAGFKQAAVAIVICAQTGLAGYYRTGEKRGTPSTDKGQWWFMFDAGMAAQNLTLAAYSLGLGTVHIGVYNSERVKQIIGASPNFEIIELMALGRPDEEPSPRPRKDVRELVFYDRFPAEQTG